MLPLDRKDRGIGQRRLFIIETKERGRGGYVKNLDGRPAGRVFRCLQVTSDLTHLSLFLSFVCLSSSRGDDGDLMSLYDLLFFL